MNLDTVADIIPYTIAVGHGQDLLMYLQDVRDIQFTAPEVHIEFRNGNFVVKNSKENLSDLALQQSANRDNKTPGGVIGLTHKESNLIRQRATVVSSVKAMTHVGSKLSSCHRELRKFRTDRDVSEAQKFYNAMGDMINSCDISFQILCYVGKYCDQ